MDLRRVRIRLTILFTALSAVVVAGMGWYAVQVGTDSFLDSVEREAEQVVSDFLLDDAEDEANRFRPSNTWIVFTGDDEEGIDPYSYPVNEESVWVEPPLQTLADQAGDNPHFGRFEQEGTWLAYTHPMPFSDERVVTAGAGSALVFNCHLWHAGTVNRSGVPRRVIQTQYIAGSMIPPHARRPLDTDA